jgi:plastocyanin
MTTTKQKRQLLAVVLAMSLLATISSVIIIEASAQISRYITIEDFQFNPEETQVDKKQEVLWTNNDAVIYTLWFVHSENQSTHLVSDPILPGETWQHIFGVEANLTYYCSERLWITGTIEIIRLTGDVNDDGIVNVKDLTIVSLAFGSFQGEPDYNPAADLNEDGIVDMRDLSKVARNLGKTDL